MTATLAVLVTGCLAAGSLPWRIARRSTTRRAAVVVVGPGPAEPARAEAPIDLGVLLAMLDAAIRSGAAVPRALERVGCAVGGEDGVALARAGACLLLGASWSAAWLDTPSRLAVVHRALRDSWERGAAPGDGLRAAADQMRRGQRAAARTAAGRLAVHLVLPLGVCYLPAFILIGLVPVLVALGVGFLGG